MSFAREKRLLVGWLALLAPLPLPFNEVLEWTALWLYLIVVVSFLRRARSHRVGWLPSWAMNLLGLGYLPFLYLDFSTRWNGQLVRPVVHLAMFAVVVKLFALKRERDKWQTLFGVFFLFLASMATSVHPAVILYVVVFLAMTLTLLTRFSLFSVLARFGYREGARQHVPLRGFVVASTLLSIALGIPLFAVLPRIKSPYIMGRGVGSGTVIGASGFTDQVSLDSIGSIRQSREVALRLAFEPQESPTQEVRLKAATYEVYDGRSWARSRPGDHVTSNGPGTFALTRERIVPDQWVQVWLQPLGSKSLPLPVQAVALELRASVLNRDRGGALSMLFPPDKILEYRVALSPQGEMPMATDPVRVDSVAISEEESTFTADEPTLDAQGITPAIRDYAASVGAGRTGAELVRWFENHLAAGEFRYTTDLVGRSGDHPIEQFLLESKEGHCEYFASALVLLLRSQGVPARLVTGFLGAEESRFEDYYVVRQSNAHAWVEAYLPEVGWQTLDPTPPDGRPGVAPQSFGVLFAQLWDTLSFRWDRYVLTFGFYDQFQIASKLHSFWQSFWRSWNRGESVEELSPSVEVPVEVAAEVTDEPAARRSWLVIGALLASWGALLASGFWLWRRRRQPLTATRAYLKLRERFVEAGLALDEAVAPLDFQRRVTERFPELGAPTRRVTELYLREAFAPPSLRDAEDSTHADPSGNGTADELVGSLTQVWDGLKRAG